MTPEVDLNLLQTLRTFAGAGGLTAAARQLGRTQAAVGLRLHRLEQELGLQLFERVGRRLVLTASGRAIEAEARTLLAGLPAFSDHVSSLREGPRGKLRIGALPTVSAYLLAPSLASFLAACPAAELEIRTGLTPSLEAELREGELDVVVSIGAPPRGALAVDRLGTIHPVLALRARRAPRGPIAAPALAKLTYIGYPEVDDEFFRQVDVYLRRNRIRPRASVGHIQSVKELVRAGAGVSILPDYTLVEPDLVGRPVAGLGITLPAWLATRKGSRRIPLVERLCQHVRGSAPRS